MNLNDLKKQRKVHFIGLGGIGMSALALILREFKIPVQGSDLSENYLTEKLRAKGITYFLGHQKENISDEVSLVVQTSVIEPSNPEILAAQERKIPIITRANLLGLIMKEYQGITIAGTHGKTTVTAMIALMLEIGELDPTIINGGIIHYFGSNSKIGKGRYLVAESDESDGSFIDLPSFIGVVTNLEPEHLEFTGYGGSFEKQKSYFEKYLSQIPGDGLAVICIDDPELEKIYQKLHNQKSNLFTYSIKKNADLRAKNILINAEGLKFDAEFKSGRVIKNIRMPIYGEHNVSNALAAIAVADFLRINDEKIIKAAATYNGVKRRFTKVGNYNNITILDDYGHHPTEIKTTIQAVKPLAYNHKIICVFQPHKYTRVRDVFNEFCHAFKDADMVIVADIYSAGQVPIKGCDQDSVINGIRNSGHQNVFKLLDEKDLALLIKTHAKPGDIVLCVGAGSITYWAADLETNLSNLENYEKN